MVNIAICDDDKIISKVLKEKITNMLGEEISKFGIGIDLYYNVKDFINVISSIKYKIIFLDIQMPDIDGFQLAKYLTENKADIKIIFVSSHENYVFNNSFQYEALWFIRKSSIDEDLKYAFPKIRETLEINILKYKIECDGKIINLKTDDIYYIESNKNYLTVFTLEEHYVIRKTMKETESELPGEFFIRPHSSFLVNLKHIKSIERQYIILEDGEKILISNNKQKQVVSKLKNYLKENR
jgi:DNA-binding LytR/AlgR family response regulator